MDSFDVSGMNYALQEGDASDSNTNPQDYLDQEAATMVRSQGWAEPENYDYAKYVIAGETPLSANDAAPTAVEGMAEGMNEVFPEWAGKAAKYEWNDEFGDVGPQNEELEAMLFRSEFINRTGLKIKKYLLYILSFCAMML